jgi:glycosyltransferase involved in cell wall biosynthesis
MALKDGLSGGMRILLVCEPGADGAFKHVEGLAGYLLAQSHHVDFAFSSARSSHGLKQLLAAIRDYGGTCVDLSVGNTPSLLDLAGLAKLAFLARRSLPSIIHCHSSKGGVLGRIAAVLVDLPVVYTPHAYYGMSGRAGIKTTLFNQVERLLARIGQTINVSEDEALFARGVIGVNPSRQSVIPNAVDTKVFKPAAEDEKQRLRLAKGLPRDSVVVGTLGRLSYQKDPLTLYRAFEMVARHHANLYLAHLGAGELANNCQGWIDQSGLSSRILRMDYSPEPSDFYRALDAFVLSSRYEGLSLAVLEALATNLPLVLTDVLGNRDFFKLGLSHLWSAPAENPAALASAIGKCVGDLSNATTCNHRRIAIDNFSQDRCFGRIIDLYTKVTR